MGDLYAIATAICWSSAVIFFDISSKKFNAIHLNAIKNFIGITGFLATIFLFSIPVPNFSGNDIFVLFVSGILGIFIADLLFLESLNKLGSSISALVSTIYAPAIFIIAFILFNETISFKSYFGGILVIIGIVITVYKNSTDIIKKDLYAGICFGILAQIFTAYSVLVIRPILYDYSILYIALYRFSFGLLATISISFLKYGVANILSIYKKGLRNYYVLMGSFLGTYLSVVFWLAGFKYTLAGRAAIYNQLSTIIIVILARIFLKEPLNKKKIIGVIVAIIGAIVVSLPK